VKNLAKDHDVAHQLFRQAIEEQSLWTLSDEDEMHSRTTLLLGHSKDSLVFQWPEPSMFMVHTHEAIWARAKVNNILIEVKVGRVLEGERVGKKVLVTAWPEIVYFHQKRLFERFVPKVEHKASCMLWISKTVIKNGEEVEAGEWVTSNVRDLSGGGLSFLLRPEHGSSWAWRPGRILTGAKLILGEKVFDIEFKVERIFVEHETAKTAVGVSFHGPQELTQWIEKLRNEVKP